MLRGVEKTIATRKPCHSGTADHDKWTKKEKVVRAVVEISLSDNILEEPRNDTSDKDVRDTILSILQ